MDPSPDLNEIRRKETADIQHRREVAGVRIGEPGSGSAAGGAEIELTGLALSGGGIRAAALAAGFVQAMHRAGLYRYFDYLSTVSGGGYIGGYLSSSVIKNDRPLGQEDFDLSPKKEEGYRQPSRIMRWIYGGRYLNRPWELLNKYLIGVFAINLAFFTGLLGLTALVAYLWRCLDFEAARDVADLVGLDYDLWLPFVPAGLLFVAWVICWAVSYWRAGAEAPGRWAGFLLYAWIASLLVGVALLLGNGTISLGPLSTWAGKTDVTNTSGISKAIIAVVIGALIPFLNPARLLKSGLDPQKWWEPWVFRVACTGLFVGVPMLCVSLFAVENISGFSDTREPKIIPGDVKNWDAFCGLMNKIYESPETPKGDPATTDTGPTPAELIEATKRLSASQKELDALRREFKGDQYKSSSSLAYYYGYLRQWWLVAGMIFDRPAATTDGTSEELANGDESPRLTGNAASAYLAQRKRVRQDREALCNKLYKKWNKAGAAGIGEVTALVPTKESPDTKSLATPVKPSPLGRLQSLQDPDRLKDDLEKLASVVTAAQSDITQLDEFESARIARDLVMAYNPHIFSDPRQIYRTIVINEDQKTRLLFAGAALAIFFTMGLLVDLNATSLHRFYRNRLSHAFIETPRAKRDLLLSELRTTDYGAPYPLINASVLANSSAVAKAARDLSDDETDREYRQVDGFLFSRRYCGSQLTGYRATDEYESYLEDNISLADAVALSGAANPAQLGQRLLSAVMVLCNLRLGQWLPNPAHGRPCMRARVATILGGVVSKRLARQYCFISDGGLSDNLGVISLLRRRCRLIVSFDASYDPKHECGELARAIRWARVRRGIEFQVLESKQAGIGKDEKAIQDMLCELRLNKEATFCGSHFVTLRIKYPYSRANGVEEAAAEGLLVYAKSSLTGDESSDLRHYRATSFGFPHDNTADVLFDSVQMESYRALGEHIGKQVARAFDFDGWSENYLDLDEVMLQMISRAADQAKKTAGQPPAKQARKKRRTTPPQEAAPPADESGLDDLSPLG